MIGYGSVLRMLSRAFTAIVVSCAALLTTAPLYARSKTDIIVLLNGDHLTGEIKQLYYGRLSLSTDAMNTVSIEWSEISELKSQYYFEFEDKDGYKYYGTPELSEDGKIRITRRDAVVTLEKDQVIRITPIEKTFWSRLKGSVNLGVSYTKGTGIGRLDFAFNTNYREEKNYVELSMSTNLTTEREQTPVQRSEATLTYQRLFQKKLYADATGSTFRNDEIGIALRVTLAGGLGAHVIQTNHNLFESALGAQVNREWSTDPTVPPTTNLEGVLSLGYKVFKYNTPKTDLNATYDVYPRLPDFDRLRMDTNISLTQEIVKDFTIVFTFWDNYDSDPPSADAANNDWGLTTSIGYKW